MVNISHYGLYPIVIFWLYTHVILFTCIFSCVSFNAVSLFGALGYYVQMRLLAH